MTARDRYEAMASALDAHAPPVPRADDGVILIRGSDITPEPIAWLWRNWLALGKLHLLAGAPGQGKTTIALAATATVTTGGRWPDGSRCERGNVLIWSGEDDSADTLLPRLIGMGADRDRVFFIKGARIGGEVSPFDPARDLVQLTEAATRIGDVKLLIVDPIVSAVTGDSHKNTEVRRAMQPLVDLASHLRAAALGITHLSKGTAGRDPTERVTGSIAFTAVVRVVLLAAKVKGDNGEDKRILVRSKSNIGPDDGGFEYHIEQVQALPGIAASVVTWGNAIDGTARELLAEAEADPQDGSSAKESAEDFLRELLTSSTPTKNVQSEAKEAGHAWATVRRASEVLGVIKKKGESGWYWRLPQLAQEMATCSTCSDSESEQVEQVEGMQALSADSEVL
ncbi:MAG: AAA family ATPase [Pseudomonadota bacterium]